MIGAPLGLSIAAAVAGDTGWAVAWLGAFVLSAVAYGDDLGG
jgi:hypothetical protein